MIERLYGNSSQLNDAGQYAYYGRVGGCLITGNEDGAKHCSMNILYSLQHLGYTIPPQADSGWMGEAGPGPARASEVPSAVLRVGEVEPAARVPLGALVGVRRDAAGVLEHPRDVHEVPGHEGGVGVWRISGQIDHKCARSPAAEVTVARPHRAIRNGRPRTTPGDALQPASAR